VFLKPQVDAAAAQVLADRLRRRADVAAVAIKTPEQGLAEFRNQSGFAEALKLLQSNPLPTVLIVTPKLAADATTAPPPLVAELEHESGVDQVQYDALWRQRLDAILAFTARAAAVLAILLGLAAVLVVGNSVRTDIATRSEEIAVMQLLGANNAFVRRPFLYAGLVYGACAGMAALAIVIAVQIALAGPLGQLAASYGERFAVHGLGVGGALVVLGIGVLLGWIGAWLATARHLARGQIS
jgi:cell division transport system permease protein